MALRNAFEDLLTERTGRLILAATNYARDINDRLRVIVDGGTITAAQLYMNGSSSVTYRLWNDPNAVYTVDQRDDMRQQSIQHGKISRQRWTFN